MDKKSRNTLKQIVLVYEALRDKLKEMSSKFEELENKLSRLESDEHFKLDNTPENLQNTFAYDERADKADMLTDISASATLITVSCNELIGKIEDLLDDADDVVSD